MASPPFGICSGSASPGDSGPPPRGSEPRRPGVRYLPHLTPVPQLIERARLAMASNRGRTLFVLALALRLLTLTVRAPDFVETENLRTGFSLASLGYLGNPFSAPTGPTAHVAPVYPLVVAAVHRFTMNKARTVGVLRVLGAVVGALNVVLLLTLARTLRLPEGAGTIAALFWVVPYFTWIELSGEHETVFTITALLLVLIITLRRLRAESLTGADGAMIGAAIGIGVHFSPLVLPALLLMIAVSLAPRIRSARVPLRFVGGAACAFLVVVAPYAVRNQRVMGGWMLVRDNLGLELAMSNASNAFATADANFDRGSTMTHHPFASVPDAGEVRRLGEVAYNKQHMQTALAWIRANPGAFGTLVTRRAALIVVPYARRPRQHLAADVLALLALMGFVRLWRDGDRAACLALLSALVGYEVIYLLIQYDIRYVYPALWLESLAAGYFLWRPLSRREVNSVPATEALSLTPRVSGGAVLFERSHQIA